MLLLLLGAWLCAGAATGDAETTHVDAAAKEYTTGGLEVIYVPLAREWNLQWLEGHSVYSVMLCYEPIKARTTLHVFSKWVKVSEVMTVGSGCRGHAAGSWHRCKCFHGGLAGPFAKLCPLEADTHKAKSRNLEKLQPIPCPTASEFLCTASLCPTAARQIPCMAQVFRPWKACYPDTALNHPFQGNTNIVLKHLCIYNTGQPGHFQRQATRLVTRTPKPNTSIDH